MLKYCVDKAIRRYTDFDARVRQIRAAGAHQLLRETPSGAKADRSQLRRVVEALEPSDVLTVTRLARLARSTRDLLNAAAAIAEHKAGFLSLDDPCGDTRGDTTWHGRPMLTVLGGLVHPAGSPNPFGPVR
ncbi:MAG: recombinase family protein [Acetobacteraceae bacterium]